MNPTGWIRDPVATKELSGSARHWQTFAFRGLHLALMGAILWSYRSDLERRADWFSASSLAQIGRDLFNTFVLLQAALVMIAGVSAASDLVTKEVRQGTLGLLVCTPLRPWRVAFGKWRAAVTQTLTLLLCGAPVLAICSYLGGATPQTLLCALTVSAAAGGLAAAFSLYCSSLFRSATTALIVAAVALAAYLFLPLTIPHTGSTSSDEFAVISHVQLLFALAAGSFARRIGLDWAWVSACAVTAGLILAVLKLTAARIATLTVRTPAPPVLSRAFQAIDAFYEDLGPEKLRGVRVFAGKAGVWERGAIYWKELNTRASGRLRNAVRIAVGLILLLSFTFLLDLDYLPLSVWVSSILFWYLALANGASLFVTEKEERKWDILLATPLSSSEILAAKLLAGFVPLLPVIAAMMFFWGILRVALALRSGYLLPTVGVFLLPAVVGYLLAAFCSLVARSLRSAVVSALAGLLALVLVIPWIVSDFRFERSIARSSLSPLYYLRSIGDHGLSHQWWTSTGDLAGDFNEFMLLYGALAAVLLAALIAGFNRITGRNA